MAETLIEVDRVWKSFRVYHDRNQSLKATLLRRGRARHEEFWALRDVSLDVRRGESVGLIGENGSGKSTLLKCLARILRPERGSIDVTGKISALLELGAGFHPELSGRDNVYLNGTILGLTSSEIRRRFDDIVGFAGLERFIDTPVKNYSSGMYVRLGFAVAINVEPDVLLVDEVLAVGDEQFQRRCNERFADLRAAGTTIIVVSHALGAVRAMCDRAVWLEHGEVKEIGGASEVIDGYLSSVNLGDRSEGPAVGDRWGGGEATIRAVELIGPDGRPTSRFRTGDAVTFRLHYDAPIPVPGAVFGIAVHTVEGMHVTGPNTKEAGAATSTVSGRGTVDLVVDRCLLLPGTYDLSAAFTDNDILHTFDYRHRVLRFDVLAGDPHETFGGVVSLGGRWEVGA